MPPLRRLAPLARALATPGGRGAALRWRPFSITAFEMARALRAQARRAGLRVVGSTGGGRTPGRVRHVLLEVGLTPSYEGEPTSEALVDFLRPFGFRFLRPVDLLRDETGTVVQMDAPFERTS